MIVRRLIVANSKLSSNSTPLHSNSIKRCLKSTYSPSGEPTLKKSMSFQSFRQWIGERDQPTVALVSSLTAGFVIYGVYELYTNLKENPEYHFNREERRTIDYIENKRDPKIAEQWKQNVLASHEVIPETSKIIKRSSSYKRPEDYVPENKEITRQDTKEIRK
jgi:hypothetical protein